MRDRCVFACAESTRAVPAPTLSYGDPELIARPCPACGCADVFTASAPPGTREMPLYPACCRCGQERDDLDAFYADPPTQPRLAV